MPGLERAGAVAEPEDSNGFPSLQENHVGCVSCTASWEAYPQTHFRCGDEEDCE